MRMRHNLQPIKRGAGPGAVPVSLPRLHFTFLQKISRKSHFQIIYRHIYKITSSKALEELRNSLTVRYWGGIGLSVVNALVVRFGLNAAGRKVIARHNYSVDLVRRCKSIQYQSRKSDTHQV